MVYNKADERVKIGDMSEEKFEKEILPLILKNIDNESSIRYEIKNYHDDMDFQIYFGDSQLKINKEKLNFDVKSGIWMEKKAAERLSSNTIVIPKCYNVKDYLNIKCIKNSSIKAYAEQVSESSFIDAPIREIYLGSQKYKAKISGSKEVHVAKIVSAVGSSDKSRIGGYFIKIDDFTRSQSLIEVVRSFIDKAVSD